MYIKGRLTSGSSFEVVAETSILPLYIRMPTVDLYIYIYIYMHIHICVYIYIYDTYMYSLIHVHRYTCICIYIYIYIYWTYTYYYNNHFYNTVFMPRFYFGDSRSQTAIARPSKTHEPPSTMSRWCDNGRCRNLLDTSII